MLDLSNVTLWACVWTPSEEFIDRTFRVVRHCTRIAKFQEVVFFCCVDPRITEECGWRIVRIPELNMASWNLFINREIPKSLHSDFAMSVHEDGFILDPSLWEREFLDFDYIGAPWPSGVVGNQGFCIESRKMLKEKLLLPKGAHDSDIPSDNFLCIKHRERLERRGIRFAPQSVAERFSTEMYGDEKPSFGFHGRKHSHRKYREGWERISESEKRKYAVLTGHLSNYAALAKSTIYENKQEYCNRHGYSMILHTEVRAKWQDTRSHASGFSWSRLEHMAELVASGDYDWVWCVGCDTLITNLGIKLESITGIAEKPEAESWEFPRCPHFKRSTAPKPVVHWRPPPGHKTTGPKHLIACGERVTPIQADSFLVRGSQAGLDYLNDILRCYPQYRHHPWVENQAMIDFVEKHASITLLVPQHLLNAYDYSCFYHVDPMYRDGIDCYGNRGQWMPGDFIIHWPGVSLNKRMELLQKYMPQVIK